LTKPVAISRSEALALLATGRVTDQAATAVASSTNQAPLPTTTQAEAR